VAYFAIIPHSIDPVRLGYDGEGQEQQQPQVPFGLVQGRLSTSFGATHPSDENLPLWTLGTRQTSLAGQLCDEAIFSGPDQKENAAV
jgi:hypothetical protein